MRILYLSNSTIPSNAANGIQVMQMCQAFMQIGHKVTLVCGDGGGKVDECYPYYGVESSFEVLRFSRPSIPVLKSLVYAASSRRAIKQLGKPDLIYGRDPALILRLSDLRCPIVYESHSAPSKLRGLIESRVFRSNRFHHLVTISNALSDWYVDSFGMPIRRDQIVVAHDAASPPIIEDVPDLKRRPGALQIGYFGHLYVGKGGEVLCRMADRMPMHDFHVFGGRPQDQQRIVDQFGPQSNVFFHGFVRPSKVASYREQMDVLLAPYQESVSGGGGGDLARWMSPLKLFEYLSSAKPMIVSRLPVLEEVLNHEENCLFVDPSDVGQWVAAVHRLEDQSLRDRLGRDGLNSFQQRYTWKHRASTVLDGLADSTGGDC